MTGQKTTHPPVPASSIPHFGPPGLPPEAALLFVWGYSSRDKFVAVSKFLEEPAMASHGRTSPSSSGV